MRSWRGDQSSWSFSGQAKVIPRLLLDAPPSTEGVQGHGVFDRHAAQAQRVPVERPQGQWP